MYYKLNLSIAMNLYRCKDNNLFLFHTMNEEIAHSRSKS